MKDTTTIRWYKRLFDKLISKNVSPRDAEAAVRGTSKHARGQQRPRDFDAKRKTRRKMARESRRINRARM